MSNENKRGKTIQIFLTNGTPRGIKIAEITSNIEQAVFIPRSLLAEADSRKEVSRPGIYFLFGEDEESAKPIAYIGQAINAIERVKQHNKDKSKMFWNYAVIIVSKTESFTRTHIEYLEQLSIKKAIEASQYKLTNSDKPKEARVPETLEADLLDNFDTVKILLSTLGFTIFETIEKDFKTANVYYCKGKGVQAEGEYSEDGFVVYKDSQACIEFANKTHGFIRNLREKLLKSGILKEEDGVLVFQENYQFNSPSSAGSQILGRPSNGWKDWKTKDGKTLDEKVRNE